MFVLENGQYAEITFEELQRREKEDKGYKDKYFLPLHGMLMEVTNHVPIPHNLETRDDTIITYIIENIEYGHPQSVNNDKIDYLYEANEKYIIKITPNQTSSAELKVIEGRELIIDENKVQQIEVYDTKSYMRLQPDEEQTYTVTLSNVPENSVFSVNVLDDDFKTISVVKFGEFTNQIIRFAVNANQTYYMVVNSTDGSISTFGYAG